MKITLKGTPPSMNKFAGRKNEWEYRKQKQLWSDAVYLACLPKKQNPPQMALVRIDYFFNNRRRHDPDNYGGKFLLDGLTKAGAIADDDFAHISLSVHGHYDKKNPRTEITVVPMAEEMIKAEV